ncbi:hypothetical protein FA15DRAFT_703641 [Coprinopsis marcescibilis]|uniref:Uncharacterized protein n=1 Tax=Coprinopsis marcescibilis TaxID=230819 RepID=A0A5C3KY10_COPMA|nr:hypothetical protein FA15DRAFT_703641 [Coprinopsis marcescibilis]
MTRPWGTGSLSTELEQPEKEIRRMDCRHGDVSLALVHVTHNDETSSHEVIEILSEDEEEHITPQPQLSAKAPEIIMLDSSDDEVAGKSDTVAPAAPQAPPPPGLTQTVPPPTALRGLPPKTYWAPPWIKYGSSGLDLESWEKAQRMSSSSTSLGPVRSRKARMVPKSTIQDTSFCFDIASWISRSRMSSTE